MTIPREDLPRLAAAIKVRRKQLGLSVSQSVKRARAYGYKISENTWFNVETHKHGPHGSTQTAMEAALDYAPGAFDAILAGNEPTIIDPGPGMSPIEREIRDSGLDEEIQKSLLRQLDDLNGILHRTIQMLQRQQAQDSGA